MRSLSPPFFTFPYPPLVLSVLNVFSSSSIVSIIMPPSNVSIPVRPDEGEGATATSKPTNPIEPVDAFDQQILRDFELWLADRKGYQALTANKRAYLRMILDPDYIVPRLDQLGVEKSKEEIRIEQSKIWKLRAGWDLDTQNQVL